MGNEIRVIRPKVAPTPQNLLIGLGLIGGSLLLLYFVSRITGGTKKKHFADVW